VQEATNPDDVVRSRLRSVLAEPDNSVGERAVARPSGPAPPGWPTGDEGPLSWTDLIPSWPDDIDLDADADAAPASAAPPVSAAPAVYEPADKPVYEWRYEGGAEPLRDETDPSDGRLRQGFPESADDSGGARRIGLGAFDPGRRGVRALAVVAVVVVLIAAVLAWRARPRVDPVPPVPSAVDSPAPAGGAGAVAPAKTSAGAEVVVAVGGKVRKPGLVRLPAGARVADALQAAGGADPGVDVALLNLARKVVDGELILVGVTPPPGAVAATGAAGAPAAGAPQGPVNLNTATLADLDTLPGVGPVLAQRILDAREAQGGFTSVGDLRKVDGIGDSRYEQLKDLVTV